MAPGPDPDPLRAPAQRLPFPCAAFKLRPCLSCSRRGDRSDWGLFRSLGTGGSLPFLPPVASERNTQSTLPFSHCLKAQPLLHSPAPAAPRSVAAPPIGRRTLLGTGTATAAGVAMLGGRPAATPAWCGDPYPNWTRGININQGTILFKGGRLFLRVLGDEGREGRQNAYPVVLVPGGPLVSHDYLETLEFLGGMAAHACVMW